MPIEENRIAVSIVMPVYNTREDYLREAIDSVIHQSLTDWELICVDDGSKEETLSILRGYTTNDSRIRLIESPHLGAGGARNLGLSYAMGKTVIFLDSDDVFAPSMLEKIYHQQQKTDADIVIFSFYELEEYQQNQIRGKKTKIHGINLKKKIPELFSAKEAADFLFTMTNTMAWNKLFKCDFLRQTGILFTDLGVTHDFCFVSTLLPRAERITTVSEPLLYYRTGNLDSLTHTDPDIPEQIVQASLMIKRNLEKENLWPLFKQNFIYCFLDTVKGGLYSQKSAKAVQNFKESLKTNYFPALELDLSKMKLKRKYRPLVFYVLDKNPIFGKRIAGPKEREIFFGGIKIFRYKKK